jgi:predicted AAA+ superfamily ATPase
VINYLKALQNSFFIYEVPRYDIQGKHVFEINHKYYMEDLGIRNSIVGYNQARNDAKLLENIVFMQLCRKRYKVYVGVIGDREIDFVAEKNNEKIYMQVALNVDSEETMQREFGNLQLISDNYPKYVVTRHANSKNTINGIKHVSIEEFLSAI